jgi:hypothetical protein
VTFVQPDRGVLSCLKNASYVLPEMKVQRRAPKVLAGWRQAKYSNDRRFEAGITIATVEMRHARWSFRLISKPVVADLSVEHALKIITVATILRRHGRSLDLLQASLYLGPPNLRKIHK